MQCPHLFALWRFLSGEEVSSDPLIRWGLIHPSNMKYNYISCVFSGYHAIRREFKQNSCVFMHNQVNISSDLWSVFADSFQVEVRELSAPARQFSLPEFLTILTNN